MSGEKKIGILTSGGDAPGMNATIRAVTRYAIYHGIKVFGIKKGYNGLVNGEYSEMSARSVSDIIHRGGTILLTARSPEMMKEEGQQRAYKTYQEIGLDALIVIGGDGSIRGAEKLAALGANTIAIPGTIDLDLSCTDYTIGFDTAVNTAMEAINKIRDTSTSHERCSVVEVMGRNAGYLALWCAITGGAEEVLLPELKPETGHYDLDEVLELILVNRSKGKTHNLIVVAEGVGGSNELAARIQERTRIETRATILGHLQRGGTPTATDRMHASMMGMTAVETFLNGKCNRVVTYRNGKYNDISITEGLNAEKELDRKMYELVKILAV